MRYPTTTTSYARQNRIRGLAGRLRAAEDDEPSFLDRVVETVTGGGEDEPPIEVTGGGGGPDGSESRGTGEPGSAGGTTSGCPEGEWWNWATQQCEPEPDPTDCPDGMYWDAATETCVKDTTDKPVKKYTGGGGGGYPTPTPTSEKKTRSNWTVPTILGALAASAAGATVGGVMAGGIATLAKAQRPLIWAAGGGVLGALAGGGTAVIWIASQD